MEKKSLLVEKNQENVAEGFSYGALIERQQTLFNKIEELWHDLSNNERRQITHVVFKNSIEDGLSLGETLRFTKDQYRDGVLGPRFIYAHPEVQKKMTDLLVLEDKLKIPKNSDDKYFADKLMAVEDMYMNGADQGVQGDTVYDRTVSENILARDFKNNSLAVKQLVSDLEELYGDFLAVSVMSEPKKKDKSNKKLLLEKNSLREQRRLSALDVAENNLLRIGEAMLVKEKKDKTGEKLTDREKPLDIVYKTEKKIAEQKLIKEIEKEAEGFEVVLDLKEGKYITKKKEKIEDVVEDKTGIENVIYKYRLIETKEEPSDHWSDSSHYRELFYTDDIKNNHFFTGNEHHLRALINNGIHVYTRPLPTNIHNINPDVITKDLCFFVNKIAENQLTGDDTNNTNIITGLIYDSNLNPYIVAYTKHNDCVIYDKDFTAVHGLADHNNLLTCLNDNEYGKDTISIVEKYGDTAIEYIYQKEKIEEVEKKEELPKYSYKYKGRFPFDRAKFTVVEPSLDDIIQKTNLKISDDDREKCFFRWLSIGGTPVGDSSLRRDLESFLPILRKNDFKLDGIFYDAEENPYFSCIDVSSLGSTVAPRSLYDRYGEQIHVGYDRLNHISLSEKSETGQYLHIVSNDVKDTDFNEAKYYEYFYKRIENTQEKDNSLEISNEERIDLLKHTAQLARYLNLFYREDQDFNDIADVLDIAKHRQDTEKDYKEMKEFVDSWEQNKPIDVLFENILENINNKYLLELTVYEFWSHHTKYEIYSDKRKFGIFLKDLMQSNELFNLDDQRPQQGIYSKSRDKLTEIREKIWAMIEHMIVFGEPEKKEDEKETKELSNERKLELISSAQKFGALLAKYFSETDSTQDSLDGLMERIREESDILKNEINTLRNKMLHFINEGFSDLFFKEMAKRIRDQYLLELIFAHILNFEFESLCSNPGEFSNYLEALKGQYNLFEYQDSARPSHFYFNKSLSELDKTRNKFEELIKNLKIKAEEKNKTEKKKFKKYELLEHRNTNKKVHELLSALWKVSSYKLGTDELGIFDMYPKNFQTELNVFIQDEGGNIAEKPSAPKLQGILMHFLQNCSDIVKNELVVSAVVFDNFGQHYFIVGTSLLDSDGIKISQINLREDLCGLFTAGDSLYVQYRHQGTVMEQKFRMSERAETKEAEKPEITEYKFIREEIVDGSRYQNADIDYLATISIKSLLPDSLYSDKVELVQKIKKRLIGENFNIHFIPSAVPKISVSLEHFKSFSEKLLMENSSIKVVRIDGLVYDQDQRPYLNILGQSRHGVKQIILDENLQVINEEHDFANIIEIRAIKNQLNVVATDINKDTVLFIYEKKPKEKEDQKQNNNELSEDKKDKIRSVLVSMASLVKILELQGKINMSRLISGIYEKYKDLEDKKSMEKLLGDFAEYLQEYPEYVLSVFNLINVYGLQEFILMQFSMNSAFEKYSNPVQTAQKIKAIVKWSQIFNKDEQGQEDAKAVLFFAKRLEVYGKEKSMSPEEKQIEPKLKLLNMVHNPELADIKSYFQGKYEKDPFEKEEEFSVENLKKDMKKYLTMDTFKSMVKSTAQGVMGLHPKDLLGFISAKKDTSARILAERLVEKTVPEPWREYQRQISRPFSFRQKPSREAYLNGHYSSGMEGGDPLEEENKELFRLRKPISEMLVSDIYNSYNEISKKWEKLEIPLHSDLGIEAEEMTIEIPDISGLSTIRLPKTLDSEILKERIKGIDKTGKEVSLVTSTNSLGEIDISIPKGITSILYSIEKNTLPSIPRDISMDEYVRFADKAALQYGGKINESLAQLPVELEAFLLSIDSLPPKKQVMAIESFVRDISYYDFNNKETQDKKQNTSIEELMMVMSMRMDELRSQNKQVARDASDKKYAGVCADFAKLTAALLRRKGLISGVLSGFRTGNQESIGTKQAHGTAFVVFPDEKGQLVPYGVDGTPGGTTLEEKKKLEELGISKPSMKEKEEMIEEKKEEIQREGEKQIKELEELLKNGDQKAIAELANGKLEKVLNTVLKYEVNKSHAATLTRIFNAYWYTPFSKEAETLDTKINRKKFFFDEIQRTHESVVSTDPAGTELFNAVRKFAGKIEQEYKVSKHESYEKLESIFKEFANITPHLTEVERRAIRVIIAYLKADSMKGKRN